MTKLWTWTLGRQGGTYSKFLLALSEKLRFDFYLLSLKEGDYVLSHIDPAPKGFSHYRINFTIRFAELGGFTFIEKEQTSENLTVFKKEARRAYLFRPDRLEHFVTTVQKGRLLILSFGWLIKAK